MVAELSRLKEGGGGDRLALLYVDGDATRRSAGVRSLEARGHRVVVAGTGREALERLATHPFDSVLVAHTLPDLSPLEVIRPAAAAHPRLPLILLVPMGHEDLEIEALRAGAVQTVILSERFAEFLPGVLEHEVALVHALGQLEQAQRAGAEAATEHRRVLERLRESEDRFRTLFEAAADAILLVDAKGVILDANPATEALVAMDRRDIVGNILEKFLSHEDLERARAYLRDLFHGRSPQEPFEVSIVLRNGLRSSVAVRSRLVSEAGAPPYAEMLVRDVNEQKEMQRRLLAAERLASVGQMAAYIAHEINTPLANISLLTASAKRKTTEDDVKERLEKIDAQRRQAATIIADLLSFSKHREIAPVDVDLRTVLAAAADQMDPYRSKDVEMVLDLGEAEARARVDPLQMQEVFANLLKNALEAATSGSVTVRLEVRPGYRVVKVADTGPGIPADVQARLFQPFVTTKRHRGGTGLGLALCRNIVTAHGGEIHCSSIAGEGTTFTVVLPQEEAP